MTREQFFKFTILFLLISLFKTNNAQDNIISQGASWKYLDNGSNQGSSWSAPSFDDSAWDQGNAQLGFGDGDENTTLTSGYITYYFRHTFTIADPNSSPLLLLELLRDDGAVIYLNGMEVLRSNMPSGSINYLTLSSTTVGGSEEDTFFDYSLPSSYLVSGDNVIAVEIHQRGSGSSDISFDLQLSFDVAPLILKGSNWKYLDDGSNQGNAWKENNFNDATWSSGDAQLGYGDGDEQTVVSYGGNSSNKHITTYFRQEFTVNDPNYMPSLALKILRDDGAVVYLNGTEVLRTNMPSGNITYQTIASASVGGDNEDIFYDFTINSDVLISGSNTIAVEIHQRSHTSSDISFDLGLSFVEVDYLRKAPYLLHTGDNTSTHIIWQLYQTAECTLSWGTDTNYSAGSITSTEYGNDHQHSELITGLTPNTRYYYKVEVPGQTIESNFRTGIEDNSQSATFYAYGDTRTQPSHHDEVAEQIILDYTANPSDQTFIISSGDIVSNGNNEEDWDNQFFSPSYSNIQQMLSELPYAVSIGNHAGQGVLFGKYFPFTIFESDRYYYSMDYGPIHFTVIDQFTDYSVGSDQYNWLVNDLASSSKEWKVMLIHMPGWSAGGHNNNSSVQNILQPLCLTYGVQVVIAGHNHYYARAMVDGVIHITTGGGGAPLYTPNPNAENVVTVDESYHFCKFNIQNELLSCTVTRSDGSIIESFTSSNARPKIVEDDFESDMGWTFTGEFERAIPQELGGSSGNPDPSTAYEGDYILGSDISGLNTQIGDYESNLGNREYTAISPTYDCSEYSNIELSFMQWLNVENPNYDKVFIDISNDNGNTWHQVWENTSAHTESTWSLQTIDISAYADDQENINIRFSVGPTDNNNAFSGWNIDNLSLRGTPLTVAPIVNFEADIQNPSTNEIVSFTDLSTSLPDSWTWSFSPSTVSYVNGTNANSQNPQLIFNNAGSYTVSLMASNAYGNSSNTKTNYIAAYNEPYCDASGNGNSFISGVILNEISNLNTGSDSYHFYSEYSANLNTETSYSVTITNGNSSSNDDLGIWIDWNQDEDFDDVNENIVCAINNGGQGTFSFQVPANATLGETRMRVRIKQADNDCGNPCGNTAMGEVEDYTINLIEPTEFNLKVYLDGCFNGTDMNTDITNNLPLNQPYTESPWNYNGTEQITASTNDMVDWVLVEIRDAQTNSQATPSTKVGTRAAILLSDGQITDINGGNLKLNISYDHHAYIVIYHRNHIAIMSSSPPFNDDGVLTYNFTTSSGQVYGGSQGYKELYPGKWGMAGGDGNSDGLVDQDDLNDIWENEVGKNIYSGGDFDLNLQINNVDKNNIWENNTNKQSSIPLDGKGNSGSPIIYNSVFKSQVPSIYKPQ